MARLNAEIVKALGDPYVRERLAAHSLTIRGTSAQELAVATHEQLVQYARLIKQSNITMDRGANPVDSWRRCNARRRRA